MTAIPCPGCDRPRRGDENICGACAGQLARDLADISELARQLDLTRARQTSRSDGGSTGEKPLPWDEGAADATWVLRNTLHGWIRVLSEGLNRAEGPHCTACEHPSCGLIRYCTPPADTIPAYAGWLLARQRTLLRHPAVDEAAAEIRSIVRDATRVILGPTPLWFAGPCSCGVDLYARPGAPVVTCRECGLRYDVQERRAWLLEAAEDQLAYGALIAQALTTMGQPVTPERIRTWAARGRIVAHGVDLRGRPQYRVGDIQEELLKEAQRQQAKRDKVAS